MKKRHMKRIRERAAGWRSLVLGLTEKRVEELKGRYLVAIWPDSGNGARAKDEELTTGDIVPEMVASISKVAKDRYGRLMASWRSVYLTAMAGDPSGYKRRDKFATKSPFWLKRATYIKPALLKKLLDSGKLIRHRAG